MLSIRPDEVVKKGPDVISIVKSKISWTVCNKNSCVQEVVRLPVGSGLVTKFQLQELKSIKAQSLAPTLMFRYKCIQRLCRLCPTMKHG